jgi:hypothetical protein
MFSGFAGKQLLHHLKAMSRLNVKVEDEDDLDDHDTFDHA